MTPTEALAEAWASIDGKLERYRDDKAGKLCKFAGHYTRYKYLAERMAAELKARGFDVTAVEEKA